MTPRGIRNNNPGNIRRGEPWQGLAPEQTDPDFCVFESPEYGIRAMARVLINYRKKHGIHTLQGIVTRWAPPEENDTAAYVRHVAEACGVHPLAIVKVEDLLPELVPAIIRHENGVQPYDRETLARGIALALPAEA